VDIRGALVDGVEQDLVDEADDRRIIDLVAADIAASLVVLARDIQVLEIEIVAAEPLEGRVERLGQLHQLGVELVVLDDDRLDAHARGELDLVDRIQPGRVRYADEHLAAAAEQRQHPVAVHQLVVDQARDIDIDLDRVQVEHRDAELMARGPAMSRGSARFFSTR
jgi:GAF domain-containing protein